MANVIIKNIKGHYLVATPYNAEYVTEVRNIGGKWDRDHRVWIVPEDRESLLRNILLDYYAYDMDLSIKMVTIDCTPPAKDGNGYLGKVEICKDYRTDDQQYTYGAYQVGFDGDDPIVRFRVPETFLARLSEETKKEAKVRIAEEEPYDKEAKLKKEREKLLKRLAEIEQEIMEAKENRSK